MRDIEQMFAEGDFDAIRQLVDRVEAEAEAKRKAREEAEEKERQRKAQLEDARDTLIEDIMNYAWCLGVPESELNDVNIQELRDLLIGYEEYFLNVIRYASFVQNLQRKNKTGKEEPKVEKVKKNLETVQTDDDILKAFLASSFV